MILLGWKEIIDNKRIKKEEKENVKTYYKTLLFNHYEYLAVCLYRNLVREKDSKLYLSDLLKETKLQFDESILFKKGYAERKQYKALQWFFNKWKV